jgi:mono/diheme cytochrome c family protein
MNWAMDARGVGALALALFWLAPPAVADEAQIARGRYLVTIAGCSDCHTPGALLGTPDMKRYLGGSNVGFSIPGQGVFVGSNLTPDKETGLGDWTDEQIVTAIRKGKRPDGSELSGVMPYAALSHLTDEDVSAVVAFLKSLPPVHNKVVDYKPSENVPISVSALLPPELYNALPASQK